MSKEISGAIFFEKYEVVEVSFKKNDAYDSEEVSVDVKMDADIKTDDNKESMIVELELKLFENAVEKGYPFDMYVLVRGYFSGRGEDILQYQANAIAILYPYVRALVSTYTANSNVTPLILPTINVNKMLKEKKAELH